MKGVLLMKRKMYPSGRSFDEISAQAQREFYEANGYYPTEEDCIRLTEEARAEIAKEREKHIRENMRVKMCGITTMEDVSALNEIKPDFAGFVMFFPKSKRNVSSTQAEQLLHELHGDIKKVAVVVSPTEEQMEEITKLGFDYIQIHGEIADELIEKCSLPVWKAFNVKDMDKYSHYQKVNNICGYVFDAGQPGSGKTFDWNSLKNLRRDDRCLILAGGLTTDNVAAAIDSVLPDVVDVSSGIEYTDKPGKDPEKMRAFLKGARQ
jgi:phosphoribosylanthranilate isomerase